MTTLDQAFGLTDPTHQFDHTASVLAGFHSRGIKPKRPGAYVRISLDRHGREIGITEQLRDARKRGHELWGPDIDLVVYEENNTSAFRKRKVKLEDGSTGYRVIRPVYRQALNDLHEGIIDGLLVYDLDRLARETRDLDDLIDIVTATRRPARGVTSDFDLMTPDGQMMARIIVSTAQKSSQDTSRRVARNAAGMAIRGEQKVARRPFGWAENKVDLHPVEAPVLKEMVEAVANGEGLGRAFHIIMESGLPTVTGSAWRKTTVRKMLRNSRLCGVRSYRGRGRMETLREQEWKEAVVFDEHGQPKVGNWKPLVDYATWVRANEALDGNRVNQDWRRRYVLTGTLRCGRCNGRMTVRPYGKNGQKAYVCPGKAYGTCGKMQRAVELVDTAVHDGIVEWLQTAAVRAVGPVVVIEAGESEADKIRKKITGLTERYDNDEISEETFFRLLAGWEQKLAAAKRAEESTQKAPRPSSSPAKLLEKWMDPDASAETRRTVVEQCLTAIRVMPANRPSRAPFDPTKELQLVFRTP